jgi:hypothetical protein
MFLGWVYKIITYPPHPRLKIFKIPRVVVEEEEKRKLRKSSQMCLLGEGCSYLKRFVEKIFSIVEKRLRRS